VEKDVVTTSKDIPASRLVGRPVVKRVEEIVAGLYKTVKISSDAEKNIHLTDYFNTVR
jgi:hypothetical protein